MEGNVLDDFYFDNEEIKNNADIKKRLIRGGIRRTYELKNGAVLVKESEAIQVRACNFVCNNNDDFNR